MNALERFRLWVAEAMAAPGATQESVGKSIGCGETMLRLMVRGDRMPGRKVSNEIERATASWKLGPIRSEEWDRYEDERKTPAAESDSAAEPTNDARASAA